MWCIFGHFSLENPCTVAVVVIVVVVAQYKMNNERKEHADGYYVFRLDLMEKFSTSQKRKCEVLKILALNRMVSG